MITRLNTLVAAALVAAASLAIPACQGPQAPATVVEHMTSIRSEMGLGRDAIVAVGRSLTDLRDTKGDVKPQFDALSRNIAVMDSKAGGVGFVVGMQTDRTEAYFAKWEKELAQLRDEDLQRRGASRRAEVMAAYDEVKNALATLRKSYRPYSDRVHDVQRVIASDTTVAGVKAAKPSMEQALSLQAQALKDLSGVIAAIDHLSRD